MSNCDKSELPAEEAVEKTLRGHQKPVVLSSKRYEKILSNANQTDKEQAKKEAEEEQKYREYLKKGSDDLVANFKGNIKRTQDQKMEEVKEQMDKNYNEVQQDYMKSKENEEQERNEKIAKAQQLIEKLKPGPRELRTAALQSEVLRARNIQRNINEEFEKAIRKQENINKKACEQQAIPWIKEEQERIAERQRRTNNYKKELLQTIAENSKQRAECKKQLIKEQQAEREAMDHEIKSQIEKERAIMEKKRAALRKNALEAMKMVEQRRLRERMTEELEERLCCVYNTGKRQLDTLKNEQIQQMATERQKTVETNAQLIAGLPDKVQSMEAERLRRDISRMQLKFTAEEQEKIRKDKAAKQARIESYLQELQSQKEAQQRAAEEKRFAMAQRFKNTEINCLFTEAEKQERLHKAQQLRTQLKQQNEQKQKAEREERQAYQDACKENRNEKDDKFFFEYARELMVDAHKKQRPLYPFAKVVQQYKQNNDIDCERKTPKHLQTHLNIGCRQAGDSKADDEFINKQLERKQTKENRDKASILENCLKITELLAVDGSAANATAGQASSNKCKTACATEYLQHAKQLAKKDADVSGDGNSLSPSATSSAKLRYSMTELKKLNQFAAPSIH